MNKFKVKISICIICILILVTTVSIIVYSKYKENNMDNNVENGFTEQESTYEISNYITEEMQNNAEINMPTLCYKSGFTKEYLYEQADAIAIVKPFSKEYMDYTIKPSGITFGKMLVNTSIYGELETGTVIKYGKYGGIIDIETIEKVDNVKIYVKPEYKNIPKNQIYHNIIMEESTEMELGKTYLAYLKYDSEYNAYILVNPGHSLLELDIPQESSYVSLTDINIENTKIMNYDNKEFESLSEYIDKYITNINVNKE